MKTSKERTNAVVASACAAAGNLGATAVVLNAGGLTDFMAILSNSPRLVLLLLSGLISALITVILLLPLQLGKGFKLTAFLVSIAIFVIAALQTSIVTLFVLLWPWSLYRLYRDNDRIES
ncbi:hypothetical protein [Geomonas ferrireducens]|uniref:hypothetical protein n=1 Tax=Geomonas ferrireducens TaxID=2570227 RepID=UPI0010A91A43|nr:hypothetical protein [Geomonas ferrireducens]